MMRRREFGRHLTALLLMGLAFTLSSCLSAKDTSDKGPSEDDLPSGVKKMMVGAFGDYRALEEEERNLFARTYKGSQTLQPLRVKTQVVAGLNYRFLCQDADDKDRLVEVTIYQPLPGRGEPEVIREEEVNP